MTDQERRVRALTQALRVTSIVNPKMFDLELKKQARAVIRHLKDRGWKIEKK